MTTIEQPLIAISPAEGSPRSLDFGGKQWTSYIEFEFTLPDLGVGYSEMNDQEVIQLAENSGSFAFLDSQEEDIYSNHPSLRKT